MKNDKDLNFDLFYRENYPKVINYLKRKMNNMHDIEDLTNESFAYFYKNLDKLDEKKASATTWLYIIVKSRWKNYLRDLKMTDDIEGVDIPGESEMDKAIYLEELQDAIASALEKIPEQQSKIVRMSYFSGMSSNEIAERLGMTSVNVRVQLSRALKKLEVLLKEYQVN